MKKFFIAIFIIIPLVFPVFILTTPDKKLSENENRPLKTADGISPEHFQDDIEKFLCDQFPMRDRIVSLRAELSYITGKRDINGAYIGKNRLFQKILPSDINENVCVGYADKVNRLAESIPTYVILVPSAGIVLKDELPENAQMYDYDSLFEKLYAHMPNATVIKPSCKDYYRTDHHWTADGAYSAYKDWCSMHNTEPRQFDMQTVSTNFRGTLYSKALLESIGYDSMCAPIINDEIEVTADGKKISFYDYAALETKDKYNFFQGGNHGILKVENKSVSNGKVLLILKDSFANSFLPYIVSDYEKIIMLDERYTFTSEQEIIAFEGVNEIAVIKEIIS